MIHALSLSPGNSGGLVLFLGILTIGAVITSLFTRWFDPGARQVVFWGMWTMALGVLLFCIWQLNQDASLQLRFDLGSAFSLQSEGRFAQTVEFSKRFYLDQGNAFYLPLLFLLTALGLVFPLQFGQQNPQQKVGFPAICWFLFFSSGALLTNQLGIFIFCSSGAALSAAWLYFKLSPAFTSHLFYNRLVSYLGGDAVLLVGAGLFAYHLGVIDWQGIHWSRSSLSLPVRLWPIAQDVPIARLLPSSLRDVLLQERSASVGGVIGLCICLSLIIKHLPLKIKTSRVVEYSSPLSFSFEATGLLLSFYLLNRLREVVFLSPAVSVFLISIALATGFYMAAKACCSEAANEFIDQLKYFQISLLICALALGATWAIHWGLVSLILVQMGLRSPLFMRFYTDRKSVETRPNQQGSTVSVRENRGLVGLMFTTFALPGSLLIWVYVDVIHAAQSLPKQTFLLAQRGRDVVQIWQPADWWPSFVILIVLLTLCLMSFAQTRFYQKMINQEFSSEASVMQEAQGKIEVTFWVLFFLTLLIGATWSILLIGQQHHLFLLVLVGSTTSFGVFLAWLNTQVLNSVPSKVLWRLFVRKASLQAKNAVELSEKNFVTRVLDSLSEIVFFVDDVIIGRVLIKSMSFMIALLGTVLRRTQSGRVSSYGALAVIALTFSGWFLLGPSANVNVQGNDQRGVYTLQVPASFGVKVDWDLDNDGVWDAPLQSEFRREVLLDMMSERTIRVRIQGVLGLQRERELSLSRPYVSNPIPAYRKWKNTAQPSRLEDIRNAGEEGR